MPSARLSGEGLFLCVYDVYQNVVHRANLLLVTLFRLFGVPCDQANMAIVTSIKNDKKSYKVKKREIFCTTKPVLPLCDLDRYMEVEIYFLSSHLAWPGYTRSNSSQSHL